MLKTLVKKTKEAFQNNRRLISPLMGFPGIRLVNSTIKLAQQNYGEHYKVIQSLVNRFHPDIIFPLMDLSVEANALGRHTVFPKHDTPTVVKDHFDNAELKMQKQINITYDTRLLGYVETIRLLCLNFSENILKGAYVTGPYSLASLIMGADIAALAAIMEPERLLELCEFTVERIQEYIRLLTGAGAQVICVLEPSAVMLGPEEFQKFSSNFVRHIVNSYRYTDVAIIYHTCGNTMHLIEKMVDSQVDAISLDSPKIGVSLPEVAKRVKNQTILMGNIDPTGIILNGNPEEVKEEVFDLLKSMDSCENFILSTGCDLPQEIPFENIQAFIETGRTYRINKRKNKIK
jgi:uroporphyrinogen decarboxylase